MAIQDLNDLYEHELQELYDAEHRIVEALTKMIDKASSPQLRQAFELHRQESQEHIARLEDIFEADGIEAKRETCKAIQGIIAEAEQLIKEVKDADTCDAALIASAQRVEHYEMAGYGTVRTYAQLLGYEESADTLQETLDEEGDTDEKLTQLASRINAQARA